MLTFTGDFAPGHRDARLAPSALAALGRPEWLVCNLENVLRTEAEFRADKLAILTTTEARVADFCAQVSVPPLFLLGNNHVHDLGEAGIDFTRQALRRRGWAHGGVGTLSEVLQPVVLQVGNRRVALVTVSTDHPEVMSRRATEREAGVLDYHDPRVVPLVREWAGRVDAVVVVVHWGREFVDYPSVGQRRSAYAWIDAGAALVVGHHPHVVQGREEYAGRWIYYSLGNFIFPHVVNRYGLVSRWAPASNRSIVLRVDFSAGVRVEAAGLEFDPERGVLAASDAALRDLERKSAALRADAVPEKQYLRVWEQSYRTMLRGRYGIGARLRQRFLLRHETQGVLGYAAARVWKLLRRKARGSA